MQTTRELIVCGSFLRKAEKNGTGKFVWFIRNRFERGEN
jgi:hypothetical protein